MKVIDSLIGVCWLAFWLYWLIKAANSKQSIGYGKRFIAIRFGILIIALLLVRLDVFDNYSRARNLPLGIIGLVILISGLAVAVWARLNLGRSWGMPMSEKKDAELVTSGPYKYIRHPIYTGILLGMIGTSLAVSPYWFIAAAILGAYFIYSATVEEKIMTKKFGSVYRAYKKQSKMLVPFIF